MVPADFDLSTLQEDRGVSRLHYGYLRLGASIFIAVLAVIVLAKAMAIILTGATFSSSEAVRGLLAFSILLGFGAYVTGVGFPLFLPGARRILIDEHGIRLTHWDDQVEDWRWDDPALRFDLFDYSHQLGWTSPEAVYWIERAPLVPIFTPYHRRTYVTREAVDSILTTVRDLGLTIKVSGAGRRVFPGTPLIYRVTTKKRTSHPGAPTSAG